MGIPGDEKLCKAAKAASFLPRISHRLLPTKTDQTLLPTQTSIGTTNAQKAHRHASNPILHLQPTYLRSHEIIITRLQIDHFRLIQSQICSNLSPLSCEHCVEKSSLSFDHNMFTYPTLTPLHIFCRIPSPYTQASIVPNRPFPTPFS